MLLQLLRRAFHWLIEPQVLFPVTAAFLLTVIWGITLSVIHDKQDDAGRAAAVTTLQLLGTYEAQVVRALREIDQTLKVVKYWHEHDPGGHTLADLRNKGLLPPELLFIINVADRHGDVVESTRRFSAQSVADEDYFRQQREAETFFIGRLPLGPTGDAKLHFSRRLSTPTGDFDGVAIVSVDATYFVSGYEPARMGEHGILALLGNDGSYRVRRVGDEIFSGDSIDFASVIPPSEDDDTAATLSISPLDGILRWTGAREIYGFPVAVVVGLAAKEQLAAAREGTNAYIWRAASGSLILILITALMGRMSWQLARGKQRETESELAHAQRVEYLAYHDGLTGLPNRSMFSKLLIQSLLEARRYKRRLAVAFLDLDRFKQINDTLGHEAGDELLREVAARLKTCVRDSDTVARLGGDEFVVLLPDLEDGRYAATVAQKILAVIARPFPLVSQEFRVTASIGISTYPQDGADEQTLTKNADIAMYQAKAIGKNNFQFYSDTMNAEARHRLTLEAGLRQALERNEFQLYYQAKRDITHGGMTGMEALLRWEHPQLGVVPPAQFIPIAEETGLIVPIGRWVMRTACLQNVAWQQQGLPILTIAVNLTARQFNDEHLLQDVTSILQNTNMDPQLLELEITESLLIRDVKATLRILTGLKALKIRIAVDNFGCGYSSLAALQGFPLDTIKIHPSLIRDITSDTDNSALADAIITIGKRLSLTVVAQGVETREQAEFLRTHACDELQGFYFRRPLPTEQFTQLLRTRATEMTDLSRRVDPEVL